jgi:hypothetical protein
MDNAKKYLIFERMDVNLKRTDVSSGKYIFEGLCADFRRNENDRVYSKDDYLSHLEYLKEQVEKSTLLGELDHPEGYQVSMKEVSHKVVDIYYDDTSEQVKIAIELIPTARGKDAMAIADSGVPLHISSRASGYIDESGNVTLDTIYTYDLVYQPGFKNAQLNRVNENSVLKNKVDENRVAIYEWNFDDNNHRRSEDSSVNKSKEEPIKKTTNNMDRKRTNRKGTVNRSGATFESSVSSYLNEVRKIVNEHTDELRKMRLLIEKHGNHKDLIVEAVNKMSKLQSSYNRKMSKLTRYSNAQTKRINELHDYSNAQTNQINKLHEYSNMQTNRINDHTKYVDYIAENINQLIQEHNGVAADKDKLIRYANRIAESVNEMAVQGGMLINENNGNQNPTKTDVKRQIQAIKERRMQKNTASLNSRYPFIVGISAQHRSVFESMDDSQRANVRSILSKSGSKINERMVEQAIEQSSYGGNHQLVSKIPAELKPVWESLSRVRKNSIIAASQHRQLRNDYSIEMFWRSMLSHGDNTNRLVTESTDGGSVSDFSELGYDTSLINSVFK